MTCFLLIVPYLGGKFLVRRILRVLDCTCTASSLHGLVDSSPIRSTSLSLYVLVVVWGEHHAYKASTATGEVLRRKLGLGAYPLPP